MTQWMQKNFKAKLLKTLEGVRGAEKCAMGLATGDIVTLKEWLRRKRICKACESSQIESLNGATQPSHWCGEPLVPHYDSDTPTCGCHLVCKCGVASQSCPQLKWMAVSLSINNKEPRS